MRCSISQSELLNALSVVQKGVAQRATLPVLSGVLLETQGDEIYFQTTDLEKSVQYTANALVEEPGATVLPAKLITDIVKNLPDAAVHIETTEDGAVITCDSSSFSIRTLDAMDFPAFPKVLSEMQISVSFEDFSTMARKVCRVVSKDESRMILTGVLVSVEDNVLRLVATDSYRLAVTEKKLDNKVEDFSAVLPGSFVSDLAGLARTGGDISIAIAENQVIVSYGGTVFVNRRIEGKYPNYKQLIPSAYETRCIIKRSDFTGAVKRASLLSSSSAQVKFSVNVASQTVQLNTMQEVGSTQEIVRAQIEGSDVEIGFNSFYVMEGLNAMNSNEVCLELQGSLKPGIIRGSADEGYLYLIMPVRI